MASKGFQLLQGHSLARLFLDAALTPEPHWCAHSQPPPTSLLRKGQRLRSKHPPTTRALVCAETWCLY